MIMQSISPIKEQFVTYHIICVMGWVSSHVGHNKCPLRNAHALGRTHAQ